MIPRVLSSAGSNCKQCVVLFLLFAVCGFRGISGSAFAEQLDVSVVDDRISIKAEAVGLGELLSMFDRAAGTESSVPVELAGRNVSVVFTELDFDAAVDKIFEGLSLDYIVVGRRRIMVIAISGVASNTSGAVTNSNSIITTAPSAQSVQPVTAAPGFNPFQAAGFGNQAGGTQGGVNPVVQQQPAVVQTPFGPIVNARANAPQAEPTSPLSMPGQTFPGGGPQTPGMPATQTGDGQPSIFGNTSPPIRDLNKQQPASQPPFPQSIPTTPIPPSPQQ